MSEVKRGSPAFWNKEVEDRLKALRKQWLDGADKLVAEYEAEERDSVNPTFNILYSNTETLLPALYNSVPRPDVSRRYTTSTHERELDSAVGQAAERLLEYSEDTNVTDYGNFDTEIREAVLHALVPGQGQTRVRVIAEENHQELVYDTLAYDRFIWQYARKWCQVSWVGFGYDLNQEGFEEEFPEFCAKDEYKKWAIAGWKALQEKYQEDPNSKPRDDKTGAKREPSLLVWEIWDHPNQQLRWVCDTFRDEFVHQERYPFKLTSRFPCPEPLQFVKRNNNLTPKPPYALYEAQDRELQEVSKRFLRVVKAIRARGAYNAKLTELEKIFGEDSDNALVAVENADFLMQDNKGFQNAIWMVPVDMLMEVATKLAEAREQIKQTIYEITGIGDLLRGQAEAQQTATQASTQNAWGTLRLKRMQNDVSIFCRGLFRIGYEFMVNTYSQATIQDITKLEYLTQAQKKEYQMAMAKYNALLQQAQAQQQAAAQAMGPGSPSSPPQPPPPPPVPEDQLRLMAFPTWEEIIEVMRSKFERNYRIDIETNSTVDLEATEDKAAMGEFMNAFGQMAAGLENMSNTGILPYEVSKEIVGEMLRRFRFGRRVEQLLEMAQPPQGNAQAQQQQADLLKQQAAAQVAGAQAMTQQVREQLRKAEAEFAKEKIELVNALKIKEVELTTAKGQATLDNKIAEHDGKIKDLTHAGEKSALTNQVTGTQRQLEHRTQKYELEKAGMQNQHQGELFQRDQSLGKQQLEGEREKFGHERELSERDHAAREQGIKHQVETGNLKLGTEQLKVQHATGEHERVKREAESANKEKDQPAAHTEALKGLIEHTKGLADSMQKLHEAVHAPRETVIEVGPDGKKRGISRVVH
jgi:hypothetical protein